MTRFKDLTSQIASCSHPVYPWLSRTYSPMSRIPCCDLTPIIADLLRDGDLVTIKEIMGALLVANPGLSMSIGVDLSEMTVHTHVGTAEATNTMWIYKHVERYASADYARYVRFENPRATDSLRAFAIIRSKGGGGNEFWLTNKTPELLTAAFLIDGPIWTLNMEELRRRANAFIKEMRVDTPYWREYPLFETLRYPPSELTQLKVDTISRLRAMPAASRVHLMEIFSRGPTTEAGTTTYPIREFGLDVHESLALLQAGGLVRASTDARATLMVRTKDELMAEAGVAGVALKKSHTKTKMVEVLIAEAPLSVARLMSETPVYELTEEIAADIARLEAISKEHLSMFSLLCFV